MDITAIMEKTVKNTGGVAALQKIPKNAKNAVRVAAFKKTDSKTSKKTYY